MTGEASGDDRLIPSLVEQGMSIMGRVSRDDFARIQYAIAYCLGLHRPE
jgi:hypothetical protein